MHWLEKLQQLYGPHTAYGPYIHKKMQRRLMIIRFPDGKAITKQYAKFKLETKLGRILGRDETVNHKDTDTLNDEIDNLELKTRVENIQHAHANGCYTHNYAASRERLKGHKHITGDKNPNSVFTEAQVLEYRETAATLSGARLKQFKTSLCEKHDCGERSIRNMLNGSTYPHLAGAIKNATKTRPPVVAIEDKKIRVVKLYKARGYSMAHVANLLSVEVAAVKRVW